MEEVNYTQVFKKGFPKKIKLRLRLEKLVVISSIEGTLLALLGGLN